MAQLTKTNPESGGNLGLADTAFSPGNGDYFTLAFLCDDHGIVRIV